MGKKRLVVMAPNYLTGKQVIAAVKGTFKGEIVAEIYTSLDQTDFSAEIARIRAAQPDALYEFEPGGLGINFLKQFAAAGLVDSIPLVVAAPSLDPRILAAVGDAARNMHVVADWNWDLDNPANKQFVAGFREDVQAGADLLRGARLRSGADDCLGVEGDGRGGERRVRTGGEEG